MKKIFPIISILLITICLSACSFVIIRGSGHVITDERSISNIHGVNLSAYGELNITQGATESFSIQGDDNIVSHLVSENRNGILYIEFDDKWGSYYRASETIQFNLTVKDIDAINFSGAGTIRSTSLDVDSLIVTLSGAGDIDFRNLKADTIEVVLSGAGNVRLAGSAVNQKISLSGVGNYSTQDLNTKSTSISLTGAGNAVVWVSDTLDVHISGAGSVSYYGHPQITRNITGLGSLNQKGEK